MLRLSLYVMKIITICKKKLQKNISLIIFSKKACYFPIFVRILGEGLCLPQNCSGEGRRPLCPLHWIRPCIDFCFSKKESNGHRISKYFFGFYKILIKKWISDILIIAFVDILSNVNASTSNGRTYIVCDNEQLIASERLNK